jgi:hypothetical protein
MRRNVLVVLLAAVALAGADGGEFLLGFDACYIAAADDQLTPAVASGDANSLVVWRDNRNGDADIYGARLIEEAVQGTILDSAGLVISAAAGAQTVPAVASDGTSYLVAWADQRADTGDIYVCRITHDGSVLDPEGIPVSAAPGFQGEPAVAYDGTDYVVVWTDMRGGDADIYGARVTPGGMVVDTSGIALVVDSAWQTRPAVAWDGTNFFLFWVERRTDVSGDIYGARVTSGGVVLDSAGFPVSDASNLQDSPGLACGNDEILVVWHDMRSGLDTDVYGSRISKTGEVLDSAGIAIADAANFQWHPRVAFDGTNYLVAWKEQAAHGDIYCGRVGTGGNVLDPEGLLISCGEYESDPAVTFDGTHFVAVWYDFRAPGSGYNIYAARVSGDGVVLDPGSITVSTATAPQERPSAASDGSQFLVLWDEAGEAGRDIRGVRVSFGGTVLDTPAIRISPPGGSRACPAAAYGMNDFLAVWEHGERRERDVFAARVSPAGDVLDSAGILISGAPSEQCSPVTVSDGTDFLVVWQDWRNQGYDIYCARVSGTGMVLDTGGTAVCTTAQSQVLPALAYNGSDYLVSWTEQDTSGCEIRGARVSRDGVVLDPGGFAVSAAPGVQTSAAVASDGVDFLVVWSDQRNSDYDIYGARVDGTGTVLDTAGIEICSAASVQDHAAVAYDGTDFLVVWQDRRNGEQDLYGTRLTRQGTLLDSFAVTTLEGDQLLPALARGGGGSMLLAYSSWTGVVEERPYNNRRIWGTRFPIGGTSDRPPDAAYFARHAMSVVRGVLMLGAADSRQSSETEAELLDVSGRKVLNLHPGANDVRAQAPGVYFVREAQAPAQAVRKVVITR